ncbi:MAG: oxidoreductase domain protein [Chthoniobacteraceae bacterium]|nr:oxidoreductase domain protein [Chthoniobacteraceae bacterium]
MNSLNRRTFLKGTLLSATALSLPARLRAAADGANGDIRIAIIGFNGRGLDHIGNYLKLKGVRIVALCDVDSNVLEKGAAQLKAKGQEVATYQDVRKLLENKEIDAVSIATPNHWHSLAAIWAIQAGKDVYVEKPVSHNVWEGRQLVKAADAHQRIVQMGVQSRSGAGLASALEWVNAGNLGKLKYARGLCYKRRASIGKTDGPTAVPAGIDYDIWCGPAPKKELTRAKLHYDWHWVWDTGNGDLGNQGIHQMDIARRFTGEQALSPKVFSIGGRVGYVDDAETPNSLIVFHDYEKAPLIFEVRGLPEKTNSKEMDKYRGASVGVIAQYEGGHILCPNYNDAFAFDKDGKEIKKFTKTADSPIDSENHYENFIKAVRSRKAADLHGKILDGHISSALCHTGNISHRLGKKLAPDAIAEKIKGNPEAADSFNRLAAHLDANGVDIKNEQLALGEFLKMDPATERFVGNAEADQLLTREYRAPFIVPEKV